MRVQIGTREFSDGASGENGTCRPGKNINGPCSKT